MLDTPATPGARQRHADRLRHGEFVLSQCRRCGGLHFPPRVVCPACGANRLDDVPASGRGVVGSTTVVRRTAAAGGDQAVCLVDLDEGVRLMTRVDGLAPDAIRIGLRVRARPVGDAASSAALVFEPDADPAGAV